MDDLTAFLTARLDEDEAAARAVQAPSPWKAAADESDTWIVTDATGEPLIYDEGTPSLEEAAHVARHDPARVLRDVEAKRAILAACTETLQGEESHDYVTEGGSGEEYELARFTLRQLAAVWSDHPDCRPEWKP